MKKILVITYYWPPSGGAGVQRILKAVKYFPELGIQPYVVTVKEDKAGYPVIDATLKKDVPPEAKIYKTDTFEPFALYSKLLGKKSIPTGFSNESNPGWFQKLSRFVRGNFFIPDARRGWVNNAFNVSCRIIERENIDTILVTSPPHSAQLIGLKLKKKYSVNLKWIADLRDPWTDIYYYDEFNHLPFAKNLDKKYERTVLENADKIITVGEHLKEQFAEKSDKIEKDRIIVIPNGFDDRDFKIKNNFNDLKQNEFIITYTGTLAGSYNPTIFFTTLKNLTEKFPEIKFKLRFVGNPAISLIEELKRISLENNIELIPTVTHDDSIEYLLKSTILLLVIPEIKNDKAILTGKLFEYLASSKPIVCIGPQGGDAAGIITECEAGRTFERNMGIELMDYLEELVKKWIIEKNLDIKNDKYLKYSRFFQAKELSKIILS